MGFDGVYHARVDANATLDGSLTGLEVVFYIYLIPQRSTN
jgi:hypothetical protein